MIVHIEAVGPSRLYRAFAAVAGAGLTGLLISSLDFPPSQPSNVVALPARHAHTVDERKEISPLRAVDVLEDAPVAREAPRRVAEAVHVVSAPPPERPGLPFRFLGRVDAGGEASLVLYGRGRALTVSAAGPLDDEYVVDAIEESYLRLRHLPSGTSHLLELASRQTVSVAGSAAETPQD